MGKHKIEIIPSIHKDKARQKVVNELNDELTSDSRKNLLRTQLKLYDKVMGYSNGR